MSNIDTLLLLSRSDFTSGDPGLLKLNLALMSGVYMGLLLLAMISLEGLLSGLLEGLILPLLGLFLPLLGLFLPLLGLLTVKLGLPTAWRRVNA